MLVKNLSAVAILLAGSQLVGCSPSATEGGDVSAPFSVSVADGTPLDNAAAVTELKKYCGAGALEAWAVKASGKFYFNAGYDEHPNSGVQAVIGKSTDKRGKPVLKITSENMISDGLAMYGGQDNLYQTLFEQFCLEAYVSLDPAGATAAYNNDTHITNCAYPKASASLGGKVGGDTAGKNVSNGSSCLVVKMQNAELGADKHVAFCDNAMAMFYHYTGGGAAGTASFYMEGDGGAAPAGAPANNNNSKI